MTTPKKGKRSQIKATADKKQKSKAPAAKNHTSPPADIQILNPTPVNSQENTPLVPATDNNKEISVWELDKFPQSTRPIKFTPKQLLNALEEYENTTTSIDKVLENNKVRIKTFFVLLGQYDEIRQKYDVARIRKARKYGESALQIWEKVPDDPIFYQHDKEGHLFLTTAAVNYMKFKAESMLKQAQIHETGSYIPMSKQEINQRSLSIGVNINKSVPDGFDISDNSPEQLLDVLKDRKRIDR